MDFVIDTVGDVSNKEQEKDVGNNVHFISELLKDYKDSSDSKERGKSKNTKENLLVKEILDDLGWNNKVNHKRSLKKNEDEPQGEQEVKCILKKSLVLTPEFENLHAVPPFDISDKKLKIQRQKEREKSKGKKWFGLPATELTEEVKHDLEILQMRSVLDPKHFYKKNDLNVLPKYFQIGKVMDSPLDYYNDRIPKKKRKKTLVDELLADADFNKYNKRKYKEIIVDKQKTHYKAWRAAKKLKKNK